MFRSINKGIGDNVARHLRLLPTLTVFLLHACAAGTYAGGPLSSADIEVVLGPAQTIGGGTPGFLTLGGQPHALGFVSAVAASGGYVFVVDSTLPGLLRVDFVSGEMQMLRRLRDATTHGLYVRQDLVVYVVDRQNRAVIELDESGHERHVIYEPELVAMPVDVALTDWGSSVVVADELTQRLVLFESFSTLMGILPNALTPVSVAASISAISGKDQYVFVLDAASREVVQLDLNGRLVATYGEDALFTPVAMAVDECRRIFVADGHPDGLFVTSPDFYGTGARATLPSEIVSTVTDLWIDGNELYVAAGVSGVWVMPIEPGCFPQ
jgi:DNA-binding beta-propeller fold protein YncE